MSTKEVSLSNEKKIAVSKDDIVFQYEETDDFSFTSECHEDLVSKLNAIVEQNEVLSEILHNTDAIWHGALFINMLVEHPYFGIKDSRYYDSQGVEGCYFLTVREEYFDALVSFFSHIDAKKIMINAACDYPPYGRCKFMNVSVSNDETFQILFVGDSFEGVYTVGEESDSDPFWQSVIMNSSDLCATKAYYQGGEIYTVPGVSWKQVAQKIICKDDLGFINANLDDFEIYRRWGYCYFNRYQKISPKLEESMDGEVTDLEHSEEYTIERYIVKEDGRLKFEKDDLLRRRKKNLCDAQSISYATEPLYITGGKGQFLFTDKGDQYLDAVNNVAHVGHCHPLVVEAAHAQNVILNTNTRYLHHNIVLLAERLEELSPGELGVCFFVNSGSEANDLALRLARCYTQCHDIVSMEHGYHGATQSVLDLSPYKYLGKGGYTPPGYSHMISAPDPYRDNDNGEKSIRELVELMEKMKEDGTGLAGFIVEAIMGCAGQVVFPEGYLKTLYQIIRDNGGVCIADEVQIGFGRIGTHFWGFEAEDVIPDIITLGKPFGNGHPLGGVITTPEIARAFAEQGMEYFNTFGGNPVSCAIGLAVLDVIDKENLQENALRVGNFLIDRLKEIQVVEPLIGDVRGRGLFIGIELVSDPQLKTPAEEETARIAHYMKEEGVLVGIDGPYHSVLKIKPPIIFSEEDANTLVNAFSKALERVNSL